VTCYDRIRLRRISFFSSLVPGVPTSSRIVEPPVYHYIIMVFGAILFRDSTLVFLPCFYLHVWFDCFHTARHSSQHLSSSISIQGEQHLSVSLETGHSHVMCSQLLLLDGFAVLLMPCGGRLIPSTGPDCCELAICSQLLAGQPRGSLRPATFLTAYLNLTHMALFG
jgi:hypothetical protein